MRVSEYLENEISKFGSIHISLIDPEEFYANKKLLRDVVEYVDSLGTSAFMVGGSTVFNPAIVDDVVMTIKEKSSLPVILFPNDIMGLSRHADAVWFMSLLNSLNPYFITGAQMRAAPYIKHLGLEPIPLAYLIVGEGKTAGYMGYSHNIPLDEPSIVVAYALAAEFMGFQYIYIEAGSGATVRVRSELVSAVKKNLSRAKIVVGGGIRTRDDAYELSFSGADIIVTGNLLEKDYKAVKDVIEGVKEGGKKRISK